MRPTVEALAAAEGMPAHAAAVRAMRALAARVPAPTPGRRRATRSRASPGIDPRRSSATTRTRRRCRCRARRPGAIAGALAPINSYPPGGYHELRGAIAAYNGVEPENVVLGVGADDLILLCARCFAAPGRHDRDPRGADLPALPARGAARRRRGRRRRPGAHVHLPAQQPRRRAAAAPDGAAARLRRGLLRVLRRDRGRRCSTTG